MKDLRLRRAAPLLIAAIALLFALTSCEHGWLGDARLINKKHDTTDGSSGTVSDGEEATVEEGETDPFEVEAEWNKIDYVFDGNKLDSTDLVLYKVCFDSSNTPEYAFGSRSAGWALSNDSTCEYTYDASGDGNTTTTEITILGSTSTMTLNITGMTVYQYRGKNPLYDANSNYNTGTRVGRFRFYRMEGTVSVTTTIWGKTVTLYSMDLDQYLLAVDTYTKFAFVYGYITKTESTAGQLVPTEYEAVELHGDYQFYEYDPIGYVESDGTVVLYNQYKTDMINASAVNYVPSIHSEDKTMANQNSSSGIGRSPYYPGLYED